MLLNTACALHPLPENAAPLDTYAIVTQVRCEARTAVMRVAYDYLAYKKVPEHVLAPIRENLEAIADVSLLAKLEPHVREKIEKYRNAAISLEFSLKMTERNDIGGEIGILRPFLTGASLVGLKASNNRSRQNFRNFRVTDTWGDLVLEQQRKCGDVPPATANFNYPITGNIGIYEMLDTYARLNEETTFAKGAKGPVDNAFVDELTFTTALSGSIDPSFTRTSISGRDLVVRNASAGIGLGRTDEHQLIIAAYIPKEVPAAAPKPSLAVPRQRTSRRIITNSEAIASQAIDRLIAKRFLFGLDPLTTLRDLQAR